MVDKFNQYPDDQYHNYKDEGKKKKRKHEEAAGLDSVNLQEFFNKAAPVIEKVMAENSELHFFLNKAQAAKKNAVEPKS